MINNRKIKNTTQYRTNVPRTCWVLGWFRIQNLEAELRDKVTFGVYPTNSQVNAKPTGSCEFWIGNVTLSSTSPKPPLSSPPITHILHPFILPEIYSSRVACIYSTDAKKMPGHDGT